MATIFKKRVTRYLDANGRRVTKSTPGARKVTTESRVWYGRYIDADGRRREDKLVTRDNRPVTDEKAARALVNGMEIDAQRESVGVGDRYKRHREKPLSEHIADFRKHLEAKNDTAEYVETAVARVATVFRGCGFRGLPDLSASPVADWLKQSRQFGRRERNHGQATGTAKTYKQIADVFGVAERTARRSSRAEKTIWRKSLVGSVTARATTRECRSQQATITCEPSNHLGRGWCANGAGRKIHLLICRR